MFDGGLDVSVNREVSDRVLPSRYILFGGLKGCK